MTAHVSAIERDDSEYITSCSCRTFYESRLDSYADAVKARAAHKAAVADGTWQADQDAEAAHMLARKPHNDAMKAFVDAKEQVTSAAFGVIIAKQRDGDVEAARAELAAAKTAFEAAERVLAEVDAAQPRA